MITENNMVTLTIIMIIVLFEVYYIYSDESHQQFFNSVGAFLVMIFMAFAYCLFACLRMKTSYVERFTIDSVRENRERRISRQKAQLDELYKTKKFQIFQNPNLSERSSLSEVETLDEGNALAQDEEQSFLQEQKKQLKHDGHQSKSL